MLLRLLLILVVCYDTYLDKSSLQLAYLLKLFTKVVVSPCSICLHAASMLMFCLPHCVLNFASDKKPGHQIRMICAMLSLILLSCILLRAQRRGMFVVKSGRAAFLKRGSTAHEEGGGGVGDGGGCHLMWGCPWKLYLTRGALAYIYKKAFSK